MYMRWLILLCLIVGASPPAWADTAIQLEQANGTQSRLGGAGNSANESLTTYLSGEDPTATGANATGVTVTEHRYLTAGLKTADFQVKASAGFLHCIIIAPNDAAPTAGQIDIYDNTAESGTKIFHYEVVVTTMFAPIQVCPDRIMSTGIYLGFTTTADVAVTVTYR
jgi:hypothetical protein